MEFWRSYLPPGESMVGILLRGQAAYIAELSTQ